MVGGGAGAEVRLHVYDVSKDENVAKANEWLKVLGTGAFHAAVEVYGVEWSYGETQDLRATGVYSGAPGSDGQHKYREAILLGTSGLSEAMVQQLLDQLRRDWLGSDYDLLHHNCTHFCAAFCEGLGVGELPSWVTNLAGVGRDIDTVSSVTQPLVKDCLRRLRAWPELAAISRPASAEQAIDRVRGNLVTYYANYGVAVFVFLILMLFSHPKRLLAVIFVTGAWIALFKGRGADETWRPRLTYRAWDCDFEVTASHRIAFMTACSVVVLLMIASDSLFFCAILVLIHAAMHPGTANKAD